MKIYDITLTITAQLPVWPGDPPVEITRVSKMEEGKHNNVSQFAMSAHAGTHVDAPYHFIADGITIERLNLDALVGPTLVIEMPDDCALITAGDLKKANLPDGTQRLLIKTRNSRFWQQPDLGFQRDFVALDAGAAQYLAERGLLLVGVDYLSVSPFGDSVPTHRALLGAGIVALEGVNLSEVAPGDYTLYCLPLKLGGSDGAPARVILTAG